MPIKMGDRFHRAAVDGILEILKEATKADCNRSNEDGASPTLVAAYHGNVECLRLLIARGGDPNRQDFTGNTALHCAALTGNLNCLVLLVKLGANIWKLDNDYRMPMELAAMNERADCVRFLDSVATKQNQMNHKLVTRMRQQAIRDAEKRISKYNKILDKREKQMQKELKKQQKQQRAKKTGPTPSSHQNGVQTSSEQQRTNQIFTSNNAVAGPISFSAVTQTRKTPKSKIERVIESRKKTTPHKSGFGTLRQTGGGTVGTINSEILLMGKHSENNNKPLSVFKKDFDMRSRAASMPDVSGHVPDSGIGTIGQRSTASSISPFGLTQMMFLNRSSHTLSQFHPDDSDDDDNDFSSVSDSSDPFEIGMAAAEYNQKLKSQKSHTGNGFRPTSSLCNFHVSDEPNQDVEETPLEFFLATHKISEYAKVFNNECIDLEALMLLSDADLKEIRIPLGPRRKILDAIERRKVAQRQRAKSFSTFL